MQQKIIYGLNAIKNILKNKQSLIKKIYILNFNNRIFNLIKIVKNIHIQYINITIDKFFYLYKSFSILILLYPIEKKFNFQLLLKKNNLKILILYEIQDPHNLASCIRSAEAFGIDLLVLTNKHTTKIKTLINNISHATNFFLQVFICNNINKFLAILKLNKIFIIALSVKSNTLINKNFIEKKIAIIMGSEKHGIQNSIIKKCNYIYKIPTHGICSSINIAVATGIILYIISI